MGEIFPRMKIVKPNYVIKGPVAYKTNGMSCKPGNKKFNSNNEISSLPKI